MLKEDRRSYILQVLNMSGSIDVNSLAEKLDVSEMTIRRDLDILAQEHLLERVRGGAIQTNNRLQHELSHKDKRIINVEEKKLVAQAALRFVEDGDTIFLGPGTTMELFAHLLVNRNLRVITNCLPVFQELSLHSTSVNVSLVGGQMRDLTQSFHGEMTNNALSSIFFDKAFVSCNAINNGQIMTATYKEGASQQIALNNSDQRFLLVDSSKLNKRDFYAYYNLDDFTTLIINSADGLEDRLDTAAPVVVARA